MMITEAVLDLSNEMFEVSFSLVHARLQKFWIAFATGFWGIPDLQLGPD